jgi:hypothetical protein
LKPNFSNKVAGTTMPLAVSSKRLASSNKGGAFFSTFLAPAFAAE